MTAETITPLLLNSPAAARFLAIGQRTLWGLTSPRGPLPCVRIGRAVRFDVRDLTAFADEKKAVAHVR